ncbi:MAG: glucosaminidase domain-containing protein [Bacteroidales bacterium]|nr:glucosaminidase domain-containing protein [Bacteroidales bacterium]
MKNINIIIVVMLHILVSYSQNRRQTRIEFIEKYKGLAIKVMRNTGIPASIVLAQSCLESDDGNSWLAKEANNFFGIKCGKSWKGETIYKDDDSPNECFRKYSTDEESFYDYANYLKTTPRYSELFTYSSKDYNSWAKGLKDKGYATNPQYTELLIKIINDFQLYQYDEEIDKSKIVEQTALTAAEEWAMRTKIKHEVKINNEVKYIIVKPGDNIESLAKEFDLAKWQILKYNDLTPDSVLRVGSIIYIQPKRNKAEFGKDYHIVKPGETLYKISQYYAVKLKKLRFKNNLMSDEEVKPGDTLYLRKRKPIR